MSQYLVTTSFEKKYIKNVKEEKIYHFSDSSQNFNYFNYKKKFNSKKASLEAQKYCSMMADKIFEKIYLNLLNHYKIKLSKKSYSIIILPFLTNFIEIIHHRYTNLNQAISKNKNLNLQVLNSKDFLYFKSFNEFISFSQKDLFNFQISSEIIKFNKYDNNQKTLNIYLLKRFFKKIKNYFSEEYEQDKITDQKKKIISDKLYIYKVDTRHAKFLKDFTKFKIPPKKKINQNFLDQIKLKLFNKDQNLRKKIYQAIDSKNKLDKFIVQMCIKYLPSLYLESVAINLSLISKKFQTVPKFIMSNAHGWWTDDRFKFYTSFCMLNKTKYIDIQHNGTYFIIKKNPHFEISKHFRDYFIGWGNSCLQEKMNLKLPVLYSIKKSNKQSLSSKNSKKKIIFMGASIKRFFGGYFHSYLNGGNSFLYYSIQYEFLKNLSKKTIKDIILRLRHNSRDPRGYIEFLKKNFSDIKFEDIKIPASERLAKKNVGIVVVDHCSTPWLEVLFSNKPLIIFWNNKENIISSEYKNLINSLKKCQIYFDCPIAAAKRLEEVSDMSNYNWWYKDKNIQKLRNKLLDTFFFHQKHPVKIWNDKINEIFYG